MFFKKTVTWSLVFIFMLTALAGCSLFGGGKTQEAKQTGDTAWQFEKTIATPITSTSTAITDATLGDLSTNAVAVYVPKGSFDADTQINLTNPDNAPQYFGKEIQTLGAPIEISVGQPTRLNEPVEVTFKFDVAKLPANYEKSRLRVMYFDGATWEYIRPTEIDIEKGLMTFETYHFSLFGANHLNDDTKLTEAWIHSKALDKELRTNLNKKSDFVAEQIIDMTLEKMGISDKSLKGKILGDLLKEDGYKEIYDAYDKGDVVEMNQKIAVLAGKKIAANVSDSMLKSALSNLTESTDDVAAVSQAAGYLAEGDVKGAAKIIGETIADKFLITTAGKIAVEVIDYQIESWKNSEVEAAFRAYKEGADNYFYGYNVDKGDFDTVWSQMRGIRRQLELEAIRKENNARREAGMPDLNAKQEQRMRDKVYSSYKKQFETRAVREEALKAEEQNLLALMSGFKAANMFDPTLGPPGLDKGFDYETKLDVLYHFAQKMMKDTNRLELSTKTGLVMRDKIAIEDIVMGARLYFGAGGRKDYADYLKERWGISLYPELKFLSGQWNEGSMTVAEVIAPEAEPGASKEESEEGCDFDIDLKQLEGKTMGYSMTLNPTSETGGNMIVKIEDGDSKTIPFNYNAGNISATLNEQGMTLTLNIGISEGVSTYDASGSFVMSGGGIKISGSVSISKAIPEEAKSKN